MWVEYGGDKEAGEAQRDARREEEEVSGSAIE